MGERERESTRATKGEQGFACEWHLVGSLSAPGWGSMGLLEDCPKRKVAEVLQLTAESGESGESNAT